MCSGLSRKKGQCETLWQAVPGSLLSAPRGPLGILCVTSTWCSATLGPAVQFNPFPGSVRWPWCWSSEVLQGSSQLGTVPQWVPGGPGTGLLEGLGQGHFPYGQVRVLLLVLVTRHTSRSEQWGAKPRAAPHVLLGLLSVRCPGVHTCTYPASPWPVGLAPCPVL